MNRDQLLQLVPDDATWGAMSPAQKKRAVEELVEATLDQVEEDARELDSWEALDIGAALNAVRSGWYAAAIGYARYALVPPDERGNVPVFPGPIPACAEYRDALAYVVGSPVVG